MCKRLSFFRAQLWILAFLLAFSHPVGATARRRQSAAHRADAHVTRPKKRAKRAAHVRVPLTAASGRNQWWSMDL